MSEIASEPIMTLVVQLCNLDCQLQEISDFLEIKCQEPSSEVKETGRSMIDELMTSVDISSQRARTIYREVKKLANPDRNAS